MISDTEAPQPLHKNEGIKEASNLLRGTILDGLADTSTGAIADDDTQITKFHGIYQQDDRDLRRERRKQKLEKAFIFMIRVRAVGGVCTAEQWLAMDAIADSHANSTIKITTRQAFQLHGIIKGNLKSTVQEINKALMDSISACGDVNRNVMVSPNPEASEAHKEVQEIAEAVSTHLTPKTRAYYEIWLDEEMVAGGEPEEEPIYGKTYLPRKFKTGFAIPPVNDVDVFSQDMGFIAIVEDGKLVGFNVTAGGGMGMAHGKTETYPRLADVLGFVTPDQVVAVSEAIVTTQRDYGDRVNRAHARLKYTIEDRGVDWFRSEVEKRSGVTFGEARPYEFSATTDNYGWGKDIDGTWHYNMFILSGRVKDTDERKMKTGLREIAKAHTGTFRLSANQNLVIAGITEENKPKIEALMREYDLDTAGTLSGLRLNALSCVALPTCGLALAESERELPNLVEKLEAIIDEAGLNDQSISLRITGCPNGCARPYLGEIGLVGRAPGKWNLYLGAALNGTRLNKLHKESLREEEILDELGPMIRDYAKEREDGEWFGNYVIRKGIIAATTAGSNFHA